MSFNVLDATIILFLILGAIIGFKKGVINSVVTLVGTILLIVISWYLKNPIATFMYTNFPFFNFGGAWAGVTIINVLFYEAIAFILIFTLLSLILRLIIKVSNITEKLLKATVVLSIPSKILGAILGIVEMYIFIFIALFCFNQFSFSTELTHKSIFTPKILHSTPILSNVVGDAFIAVEEIYDLGIKYKDTTDKTEYNKQSLEILLKYKIITPKNATKIIEKGNMKIEGASKIIDDHYQNYGMMK